MKLKQLLPVFLGIAVLTISGGVVAFAHSNTAARTALINKDINAFKSAIVTDAQTRSNNLTQSEFDSRVTTQEAFTALVNSQKAMDAIKVKIDNAIKANDFAAFKTAQTEMMALREANKPAEANDNHIRPTPTDAELQTKFDTLVARFKADGTLPSANFGGKGGFDGGFGGGHKGGKGRF
jgi:hypothetical protein